MRDEMDGRLWVANHDRFSNEIGGAVRKAAGEVGNFISQRPGPGRVLVSMVLAAGVTLVALVAPLA